MYAPFWQEITLVLFSMQVHIAKTEQNLLTMMAFLADGDPPSNRTTMVLTPHMEGHTSGWFEDPSRVDQTLVPIKPLHGTQPAVEASVAAVFSTPIDECSNNPTHHEHQRPSQTSSVILPFVIDPNFLNDWNTFYDEFVQSPTYARAYSENNRSSSIADDNDDDDTLTSESNVTMTTTSTQWLRLALQELEKVNWHICNILGEPYPPSPHPSFSVNHPFPAMTVPPLSSVENPQYPKPCPEPPRDCELQHVSLHALPPEPDPDDIQPQRPATQIDCTACASAPCYPNRHPQSTLTPMQNGVGLRAPPPAPDPAAIPPQRPATQIDGNAGIARAPCHLNRHPQSKPPPIPNWAKPAVPPPAIPMVGVVYTGTTHWPPPRPPMKSAPFKKKPQIKPVLVTRRPEKDSLRPP